MAKIYPLDISAKEARELGRFHQQWSAKDEVLPLAWKTVVGRFVAYEQKAPGVFHSPSGLVLSCADVICTADGAETNVYGAVEEDLENPTGVYAILNSEAI